jgi:hypothetical protein
VGADRADREAIGVELGEDDDGADGLTGDWSEAGRVCRRMDDERACRSRRKTRDGAPSQPEEGAGKRSGEARSRSSHRRSASGPKGDGGEGRTGPRTESGKAEGIGVLERAYEEAKGRYDDTTGEGAEQVTLSAREEGTAKDKAGIPIADSEYGIRLFWAQQPETPDVGERSLGGSGRKPAAYHEEPVVTDRSGQEPSEPIPDTRHSGPCAHTEEKGWRCRGVLARCRW